MSGSAPLSVTGAVLGEKVTFTSKNPTDPTTYTGVVAGIINYAIATQSSTDLLSYNTAVQRADNTVGDPTVLNYFLITLSNGQPTPSTIAFANEWISPGSFSVIQSTTIYTLNVYDLPNAGSAALLTLLRANGYNAVVVT